jgi:hypothetical protein
MNILCATALEYLTENGYTVAREDEAGICLLHSIVALPHGKVELRLDAGEDDDMFTVSIHATTPIPPEKQYIAMEFFNRVNWFFALGHLELDPDDGRFRFTHTQLKTEHSLTEAELLTIVRIGLDRMESTTIGVLGIIEDDLHALAAIDRFNEANGNTHQYNWSFYSSRLN